MNLSRILRGKPNDRGDAALLGTSDREAKMQMAAIDIASEGVDDSQWALDNLRKDESGRLRLDFANCLRIVEFHPDFKGRYKFNDVLCKVLDRGTVMIEWRLIEFTAMVQERFLPEVPFDVAVKALIVAANRASGGK